MPCAALSGRPAQLTPSSAFLILPIAHTYNMAALLHSCIDVAQRSLPALQTPETVPPGISSMAGAASTPVPSSASTSTSTPASSATVATRTFTACTAGQSSEPSLFDWLALADAKQLTPLVKSCMSHLAGAAEAGAVVRSALAWPQSRSCLERLCSETMMELLNVTTGLPANFRVRTRPQRLCEGSEPSCTFQWYCSDQAVILPYCLQGVRLPDLSAAPAFEFKVGRNACAAGLVVCVCTSHASLHPAGTGGVPGHMHVTTGSAALLRAPIYRHLLSSTNRTTFKPYQMPTARARQWRHAIPAVVLAVAAVWEGQTPATVSTRSLITTPPPSCFMLLCIRRRDRAVMPCLTIASAGVWEDKTLATCCIQSSTTPRSSALPILCHPVYTGGTGQRRYALPQLLRVSGRTRRWQFGAPNWKLHLAPPPSLSYATQAGPGSDAMPYHGFCGCLGGPDAGYLVHPIYRSQSVCVTHLATGGSFHLHGDPPEVNVVVANERSVLSSR